MREEGQRLARDFDAESSDARYLASILPDEGRVRPFNGASHSTVGGFMNGANEFAPHPPGRSHDCKPHHLPRLMLAVNEHWIDPILLFATLSPLKRTFSLIPTC